MGGNSPRDEVAFSLPVSDGSEMYRLRWNLESLGISIPVYFVCSWYRARFSLLDDFAVYLNLILLVFIIRLMKNSITTGRVAVNNEMIVVRKATNEPYLIHTTIKCLSWSCFCLIVGAWNSGAGKIKRRKIKSEICWWRCRNKTTPVSSRVDEWQHMLYV